jgi:bacterioferritin-associated ferredoxin
VRAIVKDALQGFIQANGSYRLCNNPECEVVYFGSDGLTIDEGQARIKRGAKREHGTSIVCHCLGVTRQQIWDEVVASGQSDWVLRIEAHVQAGADCAHENPSGQSCLAAVHDLVIDALAHKKTPTAR